jgi:hypothetical protein
MKKLMFHYMKMLYEQLVLIYIIGNRKIFMF